MSKVEVTKGRDPETSSALALAARRMKKLCTHQSGQIKFLRSQNKYLRATDLWRAQKMERQALEIWKLKLFLTEAGHDPKNIPLPKGLKVLAKAEAGRVKNLPPAPRSRSTSPQPPSPFKYSDPIHKRKHAESFGQDEELNPNPKRRALSLTEFLESNIYASEETYTQYLADHQLWSSIPDAEDDMDVDEDGQEESKEKLENPASLSKESKEKPENTASLFEKYLALNNLPFARQESEEKKIQQQKEQAQRAQQRTKDEQKYQEDLALALKLSLEDAIQKEGKDEGGKGGAKAEEAPVKDKDGGDDACAREKEEAPSESKGKEKQTSDGNEEAPAESEDEEEETSDEDEEEEDSPAESEDEEEKTSDEDEEEGEAPAESEDEEEETSDEDQDEETPAQSEDEEETGDEDEEAPAQSEGEEEGASEEEESPSDHENEEDANEEEEEEEAPVDETSEIMDEDDGAEGEVPVSKPSEHNLEVAQAASISSEDDYLDLQYAIELSFQPPCDSDDEEEAEQPPTSQSAGRKTINGGEEEVGISKDEFSNLNRVISMSLGGFRGGMWGEEVKKSTFPAREHLSEEHDEEEAPVPEPFKYRSPDNKKKKGARAWDPDF